jgi:hypothetical protein
MHMYVRRWRFREGNSDIVVENAWALTGWAQERLVVNGETVAQGSGWWRYTETFSEPWLSRLGETELKVELRSGLKTIHATVEIDGQRLEPEEDIVFNWTGPRRTWPPLDPEALAREAVKLRPKQSG